MNQSHGTLNGLADLETQLLVLVEMPCGTLGRVKVDVLDRSIKTTVKVHEACC